MECENAIDFPIIHCTMYCYTIHDEFTYSVCVCVCVCVCASVHRRGKMHSLFDEYQSLELVLISPDLALVSYLWQM